MLPWVREVILKLHAVLEALDQPETAVYRRRRADRVDLETDRQLPGRVSARELDPREAIALLTTPERQQLARDLVASIVERGVIIQDIRRGLIDFPAWKDGREVLLCYELEDGDTIGHWHELEAGYAGRQKIEGE